MRDGGPYNAAPVARGRPFIKGNRGRPTGSQNRTTLIAASLVAGEAETLVRKAVELARNGDVTMLRFLLSRILPRERTLKIDVPTIETANDTVEAIAAIMREVAAGNISPSEGAALVAIVEANRRAIDLADVVRQIDALKEKLKV